MTLIERINPPLAATVSVSGGLVVTAGVIAIALSQGVFIASIILTATVLLAAIGLAFANDRDLGFGIALLVAAALPSFLLFQAIGLWILRSMGSQVAGGLLIGIGGLLLAVAIWMWLTVHRSLSHRGVPLKSGLSSARRLQDP